MKAFISSDEILAVFSENIFSILLMITANRWALDFRSLKSLFFSHNLHFIIFMSLFLYSFWTISPHQYFYLFILSSSASKLPCDSFTILIYVTIFLSFKVIFKLSQHAITFLSILYFFFEFNYFNYHFRYLFYNFFF